MPVDVREKLGEQGDFKGGKVENPEERVLSNRAEDLPPRSPPTCKVFSRPANGFVCPAIPDWARCSFGIRVKIGIDEAAIPSYCCYRRRNSYCPTVTLV